MPCHTRDSTLSHPNTGLRGRPEGPTLRRRLLTHVHICCSWHLASAHPDDALLRLRAAAAVVSSRCSPARPPSHRQETRRFLHRRDRLLLSKRRARIIDHAHFVRLKLNQ